jgi:hypothetical protein
MVQMVDKVDAQLVVVEVVDLPVVSSTKHLVVKQDKRVSDTMVMVVVLVDDKVYQVSELISGLVEYRKTQMVHCQQNQVM